MVNHKFENDLKTLKNEALFETFYNYIGWIEQTYPKGGKEIDFKKLSEDCIKTFIADENYRNNDKMLSIVSKYANNSNNPISVFQYFHKIGFAKRLALFYIDYAFHLESQNNFQKAMQIIKDGIKNEAQPLTDLLRTLNDLEVRTMKHVSQNPQARESTSDKNQRKALSKLKPYSDSHGKALAPIKRIPMVPIDASEGLKKITNESVTKTGNEPLNIYVENDYDTQAFETISNNNQVLIQQSKENEQKPEKWSNNKLSLKPHKESTGEKFEIFVDSNEKCMTNKKNFGEKKISVAIFEDESTLKKYFWYRKKDEIYRDNTEYSFEELRCQRWLKNREEERLRIEELKKEFQMLPANNITSHNQTGMFETKDASAIARAFFNGTIHNTTLNVFNQEPQDVSEMTFHEDFQILEDPKQSTALFDNASIKTQEFNSCSSSTPSLTRVESKSKFLSNSRVYNNPNFVNGITSKLSTIVETSREEYSKSSSSSSTSSVGCSTASSRKSIHTTETLMNPFDPEIRNDTILPYLSTIESRTIQSLLPKFKPPQLFDLDDNQYMLYDAHDQKDDMYLAGKFPSTFLSWIEKDEELQFLSIKINYHLDYWEFHIYEALHQRLARIDLKKHCDISDSVLTTNDIVFFQNGSLAFYDFDLRFSIEKIIKSRNKKFPIVISILILIEMILIIEQLHQTGIIHANISISNIYLTPIKLKNFHQLPHKTSLIKLGDFSESIDMRAFPEDTVFVKNYKKDPFYEALNLKQWNYQIDWLGLMNCVHFMIFGSDLEILGHENTFIAKKLFDDNLTFVNDLFEELLNLEANQIPDLSLHLEKLLSFVHRNKFKLHEEILDIFIEI
ncbi:mitotic checkpoint serine/threonine-protein kinase BUB1 beta-like protein [Sarcoptes scabiei]|uniref:Mitotic checkpoint serine/threonine-protein kinase BUB1 beta-like protein n=1 Tax=Sarcoptes scabiei TaxID=52283 RepID=A0A131ZTM2_SARSC|nr:mitotic checkpoint serine/threonine-protein kinase BUB1 beta-like protein [Sarcoptes scabiei]